MEQALAYLVASRQGLTDDELLEVLWRDSDAHAEFDRRKNPDQPPVKELPPILWSRLYFDLESYLIERAASGVNCYAFFHRQFGEVVAAEYCAASRKQERHAWLAAYFAEQGWRDPQDRKQLRQRTLAELPWQQTLAGQAKEIDATLTDFDFAMAKCEVGGHDDLVEDYRRALAVMQPASRDFRIWENFFRSRQYILRRADTHWPAHKILLQLAVEHADESPVTRKAEAWLEQGYCDWVWLRNLQRVKEAGIDPCTVLLERESVEGIQLLPNGRWLSLGYNWLRIWDLTTDQCVAVLEHTRLIEVLADGRLLSWGDDHTLRLWDGVTGAPLAVLEGHTGSIEGVQVLADGRLLSWADDKTLRLWDGGTGVCLAVLEGHTGTIKDVQVLPNGRLLSWGCDKTLRLWDGGTGAPLAVLEGHTDRILGVQVLPDGRLLSWSEDHTLRLWDGVTGNCLTVIEEVIKSYSISTANWVAVSSIFTVCLLEFNSLTLARVALWQGSVGVHQISAPLENGTLVVTLDSGHVFCLKLYRGNQRVGLSELVKLLNASR